METRIDDPVGRGRDEGSEDHGKENEGGYVVDEVMPDKMK